MALNKASILAALDLKREEVPVPEWGEDATVLVGELSALDRMKFSQSVAAEENKDRHYIALGLTHFIINEDGSRVFDESDAELLAGKNIEVLSRIFDVAKRINGFGDAVEETAKN